MLFLFNSNSIVFCDAAEPWQLGLQDPATPVMEGIISFHNHLMFFIVLIALFVFWLLSRVLLQYTENVNAIPEKFTHATILEIVWTVVPALILLVIAVPSFALLYSLDDMIDPMTTIKIVGHQWYWSYEYSDYVSIENGNTFNFDSYMLPDEDLVLGSFRLLEVDNRVILPTNTPIRLIVTAADVLHSWAIPSFGIKVDACPGRLSQASLFIKREGVYYGQCSEICGVNHGFMPIVVRAVNLDDYVSWLATKIEGIQIA